MKFNEKEILDGLLARCPFCACGDIFGHDNNGLFWLSCSRCDAAGPQSDSLPKAVEVWNKRYKAESFDWRYSRAHTGH